MQKVAEFIEKNNERYISELREFVAMPSVSTKSEHNLAGAPRLRPHVRPQPS